MIVFISVISFLLDGILSKYIMPNSLFLPLLTLISLIIIYPYFNDNFRYLKYISIIGFLYDIVYLDTLFFNFFIFLIIGLIIIYINYIFSNNLYINVLSSFIVIIFYRLINYLFFISFKSFIPIKILFKSIYSSLLLNILYCIIVYLLSERYSQKHNIKRIK